MTTITDQWRVLIPEWRFSGSQPCRCLFARSLYPVTARVKVSTEVQSTTARTTNVNQFGETSPITLIEVLEGEETAQTCEIAWFRQLISSVKPASIPRHRANAALVSDMAVTIP